MGVRYVGRERDRVGAGYVRVGVRAFSSPVYGGGAERMRGGGSRMARREGRLWWGVTLWEGKSTPHPRKPSIMMAAFLYPLPF